MFLNLNSDFRMRKSLLRCRVLDARKTVLVVLTMIEIVTEILYWFFPFKNDRSERNCFRISGIIFIIWWVFCMYFFFKMIN